MDQARILRVGGLPADNSALERMLRGAAIGAVEFVTPQEAIERIAAGTVDLVLLDLVQKSAEVFSVLKAASANPASRRPVIVTAPSGMGDRLQACLQRGAEDYLITPFEVESPLLVPRRVEFGLHRRQLR
ncbi:MAG: response regulator, partial [Candidatus Eremiobacteraeota bacterium]|nr:response regulator [Candidatus Eremiobacteraeota bacterium]